MRPGPHPWAENDAYVAGPDIGSDTKTAPLVVHKEDGYYRSRRPAPDIFNWQLNRSALIQRFAAKLFASNWTSTDSANVPAGGETLYAGCNYTDATSGLVTCLAFGPAGGAGNLVERIGRDGVNWFVPASSPIAAVGIAVNSMDIESDGNGNRVCVASLTIGTDQVFCAAGFGAGAWAPSAFGVAPNLDWISVGSDRNTNGSGTYSILIGDSGTGGTVAPSIYLSTDGGVNFANVATFPALAIGERIYFIGHTHHAAGALGPDDTGNPSWLILTTNRSLNSTDGLTWTDQAHLFGGAATRKCAAYSKTSRRWVAIIGAGNIFYSDDNGATWQVGAILPIYAGANPQIACDGYGTFVIGNQGTRTWISVDDGMSWTRVEMQNAAGLTTLELVPGVDEIYQWDAPGSHSTYFTVSYHNPGTLLETFRSLAY